MSAPDIGPRFAVSSLMRASEPVSVYSKTKKRRTPPRVMVEQAKKTYAWLSLLPWAILGSLIVLAPIGFFLATSTIRRDEESMTRLLVEKGAALIRSFEAGARTGMMGMGWGGIQIQRLLMETARQPDIVYLAVTDEQGVVVAHSDPGLVGARHTRDEVLSEVSDAVKWHHVRTMENVSAIEVYKRFRPLRGGITPQRLVPMSQLPGFPMDREVDAGSARDGNQADWCRVYYWNLMPQEEADHPRHYIFVGLDTDALERARIEARRQMLAMFGGALLIGVAGMVSLFLAQGYKLAQRSLANARAFSDQVVQSLPVGLVASDEHGDVASCNDTAQAILGKDADGEVLGRPASEVLPPEFLEIAERLEVDGAVVEQDFECHTGRNSLLPIRMSAAVLHDDGGAFMGHVFIFRDLTEVRRLQQEVERSRRLAALGDLAAGVAHEIRNPLSSIKGFATYFREKFKTQAHDRDTATTMIQEVERLDRVIGQLLEFARPSTLRLRRVCVADLIQHTLKLIESDARAKRIAIRSSVPPGFPDVIMDSDRMSQVLLNLYLNALQATEVGGILDVKVFRDEGQRQTRIVVSDNGRGIDPKDRERIFDPYYTTKTDGTGLGLAIVHRIMEAHGGEIRVNSYRGQGTQVTLILPDLQEGKNND